METTPICKPLQTIYGSKIMKQYRNLLPISIPTIKNDYRHQKNEKNDKSNDLYAFQRAIVNRNAQISHRTHNSLLQAHDQRIEQRKKSMQKVSAILQKRANLQQKPIPTRKYTQNSANTNRLMSTIKISIPPPSTSSDRTKILTNYNTTNRNSFSQPKTPHIQGIRQNNTRLMNNTSTGFNRNSQYINSSPKNSQRNTKMMSTTVTNFRPTTNGHQRMYNQEEENHMNYLNRYEIVRELGKGTFGVVYLAKGKIAEKGNLEGDRSNVEDILIEAEENIAQDGIILPPISLDSASILIETVEIESPKGSHKNQCCRNSVVLDHFNQVVQSHQTPQELKISFSSQKLRNSSQLTQNSTKLLSIPNQTSPYKTPLNLIHNSSQNNPQNTCEPQSLFAIKTYQKFKMNSDPTKFKNIRKQINIMQNIHHPNIIKLIQTVESLTKINIVVQYGGKQSLLQFLKQGYPLPQTTLRKISRQLLQAIKYLHGKNIIHRDLKLQNILIQDEKVKIIDFGFSTLSYKGRKLNAICGTPNYMAPELLSKKQYYGEAVDIWAYGVVMFTIAQGRHPFKAATYNQLERLVNKCNYQFKRVTNPIHQAFIKRILKFKAQDRPSAGDLLNHPWLQIRDECVAQGL